MPFDSIPECRTSIGTVGIAMDNSHECGFTIEGCRGAITGGATHHAALRPRDVQHRRQLFNSRARPSNNSLLERMSIHCGMLVGLKITRPTWGMELNMMRKGIDG